MSRREGCSSRLPATAAVAPAAAPTAEEAAALRAPQMSAVATVAAAAATAEEIATPRAPGSSGDAQKSL